VSFTAKETEYWGVGGGGGGMLIEQIDACTDSKENFSAFIDVKCSLKFSQLPALGFYPDLTASNSWTYPHSLFL
jgi:hypothetical protein